MEKNDDAPRTVPYSTGYITFSKVARIISTLKILKIYNFKVTFHSYDSGFISELQESLKNGQVLRKEDEKQI